MTAVYMINPSRGKKKKHKARRRRARVRRNPIRKHHRRRHSRRAFRRNPIRRAFRGGGGIMDTVTPVLTGAVGALAVDIGMGYLPVPDTLKTPTLKPLVKAGLAIGAGFLAGMVLPKPMVRKAMIGALTVVAHDTLRDTLQTQVPTLQLGDADFPDLPFLREDRGALDYDGGVSGVVDVGVPGMSGVVDVGY